METLGAIPGAQCFPLPCGANCAHTLEGGTIFLAAFMIKVSMDCLYNRDAATDRNDIDPHEWQVPNDAEFEIVINFPGGDSIASAGLKSTDTIGNTEGVCYNPNNGDTNSS